MWFNRKVYEFCQSGRVSGEFGLELEMEGAPRFEGNETWRREGDGSLRGPGACEYVLSRPKSLGSAVSAVESLYSRIEQSNGRINDSMRAGVHVHLNMQENTLMELFTFMTMYYCFENVICERFGEDRVGNLFCLRNTDADYLNTAIRRALGNKDLGYIADDNLRYSAMNPNSLHRYGSLEFRAMKTPTTPEPVVDWINMLHQMKAETLRRFNEPEEVLQSLSADGWEELARNIFGRFADSIINVENAEEQINECVHQIQFWVFSTDWKKG